MRPQSCSTRAWPTTTDASGSPMNGVDVVAFPAADAYRVRNSRRVLSSRTTIAGGYEIRGLPPGAYVLAVADDEIDEVMLRDPAVVGRLRPLATAMLAAGETRVQNVTVK